MRKIKKIVGIILALIITLICFDKVQYVLLKKFFIPNQNLKEFYNEQENCLDAVYIGASAVHAFWEPPLGWAEKGIAVYNYSIDGLPPAVIPFFITEMRKTQPNALLIININGFKPSSMPILDVHVFRSTDFMKFSRNKINTIHSLAKDAGYTGLDQLQFYFPIIRFHSRWAELRDYDFVLPENGLKNALIFDPYFMDSVNVSGTYFVTNEDKTLDQAQNLVLENLLDMLDALNEHALFIAAPQSLGLENEFYRQVNQIGKLVQERGHKFLNLINMADEMNICTDTDFYNNGHTNVHGAIKFTEYLADYLVENYGFTDKRGLPGWESWDKAAELYSDIIAPYTLPFEREHAARDYDLSSPVLNNIVVGDKILSLSWSRSEKAEGYDIYRKAEDPDQKNWAFVASVDEETLQYIDTGIRSGINYTYTVVPKRTVDGSVLYGNFNYSGISGKSE